MISEERAKAAISNLSEDDLQALVRGRLQGTSTTPIGHGYFDEPSEDFVVALLRIDTLDSNVREAVIAGCKEVYVELLRGLSQTPVADAQLVGMLARWCRVIDVAGPDELRAETASLQAMVFGKDTLPRAARTAVVRAAITFAQRGSAAILWTPLLEHPDVAAYAFNALLKIQPSGWDASDTLVEFWQRSVKDGWTIDVPFLMRRTAKAQGSDDVIQSVLRRTRAMWRDVKLQLERRDWSSAWTSLVTNPVTVLPYETIQHNYKATYTIGETRIGGAVIQNLRVTTLLQDFVRRSNINEALDDIVNSQQLTKKNQATDGVLNSA